MKLVQLVLVTSSIALAASSCARHEQRRVLDPATSAGERPPDVVEARWLTEGDELRSAVARAAKNPLVARATADAAGDPRLTFLPNLAVGAIGAAADGTPIRFTILPYAYDRDPTHATMVALVESSDHAQAETFELITQRDPTSLEPDFELIGSGSRRVWYKDVAVYAQSPSGPAALGPERFSFHKFGRCFLEEAPKALTLVGHFCSGEGAEIPHCYEVGGGLAVAFVAVVCAIQALS